MRNNDIYDGVYVLTTPKKSQGNEYRVVYIKDADEFEDSCFGKGDLSMIRICRKVFASAKKFETGTKAMNYADKIQEKKQTFLGISTIDIKKLF